MAAKEPPHRPAAGVNTVCPQLGPDLIDRKIRPSSNQPQKIVGMSI